MPGQEQPVQLIIADKLRSLNLEDAIVPSRLEDLKDHPAFCEGVGTLTTLLKGFRADAAFIMETTRLRICPVQSGALSFRLKVSGKAIHACMKPQRVSAAGRFSLIFHAVEKLDRKRHASYQNSLYEDPHNIAPVSFGIVRAGEWLSTVPDELVADGRLGFSGRAVGRSTRALRSTVARAAASDRWLKDHPPRFEWLEGQFESGQTELDAPMVQTVAGCSREICGSDPVLQGVPYGSDLRLFTNHGNIPAVLFGPGNVVHTHTVDEYVDLHQVVTAAKVLALLVTRWCDSTHVRGMQP